MRAEKTELIGQNGLESGMKLIPNRLFDFSVSLIRIRRLPYLSCHHNIICTLFDFFADYFVLPLFNRFVVRLIMLLVIQVINKLCNAAVYIGN